MDLDMTERAAQWASAGPEGSEGYVPETASNRTDVTEWPTPSEVREYGWCVYYRYQPPEGHDTPPDWPLLNWPYRRRIDKRMLNRFFGLSNALADHIAAFVRDYGPLALCDHGIPYTHAGASIAGPSDSWLYSGCIPLRATPSLCGRWLWQPALNRLEQRTSDGCLLAVYAGVGSCTDDLDPAIPRGALGVDVMADLAAYQHGDEAARGRLIHLAAALNGEAHDAPLSTGVNNTSGFDHEAADIAPWVHERGWFYDDIRHWHFYAAEAWAMVDVMAALREGKVPAQDAVLALDRTAHPLRVSSDALYWTISQRLNKWLEWGGARPAISLFAARPDALSGAKTQFTAGSLLGIIALQMQALLFGRNGLALCDGCGHGYAPSRKPRKDEDHYCPTCVKNGVPRANATRAKRERDAKNPPDPHVKRKPGRKPMSRLSDAPTKGTNSAETGHVRQQLDSNIDSNRGIR